MTDQDEQRRRKRARLACVSCNSRRVRCNVTESQPCDNCIAGQVLCETRVSRRGKHTRRPRNGSIAGQGTELNNPVTPSTSGFPNGLPAHHEDEVAASQVLASLSGNFHDSNKGRRYGEILVPCPQQNDAATHTATNLQDNEEDTAVFLGESNSLRYVPDVQAPTISSQRRSSLLRHSVPNAVKADALMPEWESERRRDRIKHLKDDGAFSFPTTSTRESLLKAYFQWFHPHFAIVDESEIWRVHTEGSMSPLLLQAMLFIGVIHCDNATLDSLGWGTRHRAKYLFYTRAKDIYDAEYETRKITVIQSLFLMSYWRAGALLEKDARHWLGAAINLAQTKALHRSAGEMGARAESLRRRIWWSIYIRERQCGSALGLPNRIRDIDCDVELLSRADFQFAFDPNTSPVDVERYTAYMIGMMELARILGKIVDAGYLPNRTLSIEDRASIREELFVWKQNLPRVMQLSSDSGEQPSFQASMLHLAYNNLLILLHRPAFINNENNIGDMDGNIALQAAARNSRIVEDLLPTGNIGHAQMHVITNLFNTLCIHVAHLQRSSGINKTITEHRAKLCLLGLQDLQKTWEVTNWVLQLFFQYLDRATAARLEMEAEDVAITSARHDRRESSSPLLTMTRHNSNAHNGEATGHQPQTPTNGDADTSMTPWSWTTDEANQYLFSQIENTFAFGEGGMLEWSPDDVFTGGGSILRELVYNNPDSVP